MQKIVEIKRKAKNDIFNRKASQLIQSCIWVSKQEYHIELPIRVGSWWQANDRKLNWVQMKKSIISAGLIVSLSRNGNFFFWNKKKNRFLIPFCDSNKLTWIKICFYIFQFSLPFTVDIFIMKDRSSVSTSALFQFRLSTNLTIG